MNPIEIKAKLRIKGYTQALLADELDLSKSTVGKVIDGLGTSARVQQRIAEITGLSQDVLWPKKATVLRRSKPATQHAAA